MGSTSTGKTPPRERVVASFLLTSGPVISPTFPSLVRGLQRVVKSPKRGTEPEWVREGEGEGTEGGGWVGWWWWRGTEGVGRGGLGWGGVEAEEREEEGCGGGSGGGGGSDELKVASCLSRVSRL